MQTLLLDASWDLRCKHLFLSRDSVPGFAITECIIWLAPHTVPNIVPSSTVFCIFQTANFESAHVLHHRLTEECSKRKETWISVNATEPVVGASMPRCASMVMLIGKDERGWGMCMDAALYVIYADAVIAPVGGIDELNTRCNATPHARVNLETMHGEVRLLVLRTLMNFVWPNEVKIL